MESTAALITQLLHAVEASQWLLAVPLAVLVAVYLVRKVLARAIPWIATDQGGAALSIVAAAAQSVVAAALLPGPHTVVGVLTVALPLFIGNEVVFRSFKKLGIDLSVDPPAQFEPAKPPSGSVLPLVLLVLVPLTTTGCSTLHRAGRAAELAAPNLLDCTIDAAGATFSAAVTTAAAELGRYIESGRYDVEPMLDEMLAKSTSSLIPCAIAEVLRAWQQAGSGAGVDLPADREKARLMLLAAHVGQAHLLARGYVCR